MGAARRARQSFPMPQLLRSVTQAGIFDWTAAVLLSRSAASAGVGGIASSCGAVAADVAATESRNGIPWCCGEPQSAALYTMGRHHGAD